MELQSTRVELAKMVLNETNETILQQIRNLFEQEKSDWWDTISEEEKKEIELGLAQADKGNTKPHEEVMSKYDKLR